MSNLSNADAQLDAFVELLRTAGGFNVAGQVLHMDSVHATHRPELIVELTGPDCPLLIARNGELLHAIEHVAVKMLGLEQEDHDRVSFDACNFKADRNSELVRLAREAVFEVRSTRAPHVFPPMMSRERRILHMALEPSGLRSQSVGERFKRAVVLYPVEIQPPNSHRPADRR